MAAVVTVFWPPARTSWAAWYAHLATENTRGQWPHLCENACGLIMIPVRPWRPRGGLSYRRNPNGSFWRSIGVGRS